MDILAIKLIDCGGINLLLVLAMLRVMAEACNRSVIKPVEFQDAAISVKASILEVLGGRVCSIYQC